MTETREITFGGRSLPQRVIERLGSMEREESLLGQELEDPAVISDHKKAREIAIKRAALAPTVEAYKLLRRLKHTTEELTGVIDAGEDPDLVAMAREELALVKESGAKAMEKMLELLVSAEDRRIGSVMMELRAGTGGDEAGLWCRDLFEMYGKYAGRKGWDFDVLDVTWEASTGGIRSAVVNVRGEGVWSELAFEAGVHSVKRVPVTETQGRIHTSTASMAVLPEPEEVSVKVDWINDVEETITTSQGPGGQNVNKVATAVQLHHKPSGIVIRMQESKSQQQNRQQAKRLLMTKLHDIEQRKKHAERSAARKSQIGTGERSEKIRTYRWKEGIIADERLPGEYQLKEIMSGNLEHLMKDLLEQETRRRLAEM